MAFEFTCTTRIDGVAPEVVFDLSLDPDVHVQSMAASGEELVSRSGTGCWDRVTSSRGAPDTSVCAGPRPAASPPGTVLPGSSTSRSVDHSARSTHVHRFAAHGDDTVMTDHITLGAPLGPIGWVAERLGLGAYLRHLIEQRNKVLTAKAEATA